MILSVTILCTFAHHSTKNAFIVFSILNFYAMKKIFTLFSTLLLAKLSIAQITITQANMPTPGLLPRFSIADTSAFLQIDPSVTGVNQSWNYVFLTPRVQRVDTFLSMSNVAATYNFSFAGATVVRVLPVNGGPGGGGAPGGFSFSEGYEFFKNSASSFNRMGVGGVISLSPFPLSLVNNPTDVVYRFPLNYLDADTSVSQAILSVPNFAYVEQNQVRVNLVDGWGKVSTPFGTFDAIRVKTYITGDDSVAFQGQNFGGPRLPSYNYKWLSDADKLPVLQVNTNIFPGGPEQIQSVTYRDSLRSNVITLGVDKPLSMPAAVYPNPAKESVNIDWKTLLGDDAVIEILDVQGKVLFSQSIENQTGIVIPTAGFENGTYIVRIYSSEKTYTGKLTILNK